MPQTASAVPANSRARSSLGFDPTTAWNARNKVASGTAGLPEIPPPMMTTSA